MGHLVAGPLDRTPEIRAAVLESRRAARAGRRQVDEKCFGSQTIARIARGEELNLAAGDDHPTVGNGSPRRRRVGLLSAPQV
ncbi:MAG: hypothetical protein WKF73_06430 [Nocardioidaceae bacterium]